MRRGLGNTRWRGPGLRGESVAVGSGGLAGAAILERLPAAAAQRNPCWLSWRVATPLSHRTPTTWCKARRAPTAEALPLCLPVGRCALPNTSRPAGELAALPAAVPGRGWPLCPALRGQCTHACRRNRHRSARWPPTVPPSPRCSTSKSQRPAYGLARNGPKSIVRVVGLSQGVGFKRGRSCRAQKDLARTEGKRREGWRRSWRWR